MDVDQVSGDVSQSAEEVSQRIVIFRTIRHHMYRTLGAVAPLHCYIYELSEHIDVR